MSFTLEQSEVFLTEILDKYPIPQPETLDEIRKFLGVGETEIAFESAMLCYIQQSTEFGTEERKLILEHAKSLKLDEETMYLDDFFDKLVIFLNIT
ncbi:hypothetical protein [Yoonia sp. R2-816]|uniref:hypothetical protein n=1 Tax=Yoonia sp. R2-816 TaxID=3342638 RepID=UPI003727A476